MRSGFLWFVGSYGLWSVTDEFCCGVSGFYGSSGGVGLDWLWLVGLDRRDWWILDFGFGIGVGLDQLWPVGLDRSWVLDFGFWVWDWRGFGLVVADGFGLELGLLGLGCGVICNRVWWCGCGVLICVGVSFGPWWCSGSVGSWFMAGY